MKYLLLIPLLLSIFLVSCDGESDYTTYTVMHNLGESSYSPRPFFSDIDLYEYSKYDTVPISINHLSRAGFGSKRIYVASDKADKINVFLKHYQDTVMVWNKAYHRFDILYADTSSYWVQNVYTLRKGKDIKIVIDEKTLIGKDKPQL